jgi:hypothetical protein
LEHQPTGRGRGVQREVGGHQHHPEVRQLGLQVQHVAQAARQPVDLREDQSVDLTCSGSGQRTLEPAGQLPRHPVYEDVPLVQGPAPAVDLGSAPRHLLSDGGLALGVLFDRADPSADCGSERR